MIILLATACKKETIVIKNNNAPYYDGIPTVLVEFYVNRLFNWSRAIR